MSSGSKARSRAGRPRDDQVNEMIHEATLALLAEVGYAGVTLAEVARRASTVPPTVYRRYSNLQALVHATLQREFAVLIDTRPAETGSLRGDLIAFAEAITAILTPQRVAVTAGLLLPMQHDPALASTLRDGLAALGEKNWGSLIARAVDRGELDARAQRLQLLSQITPSMIFHQMMLMRLPVDDAFVEQLVDRVLLPALMAAASPAAPTPPTPPGTLDDKPLLPAPHRHEAALHRRPSA